MSTGVAIIGFILCFLAGGAIMWGYDSHRLKGGGITADASGSGGAKWADADSPIPVTSEDPVWGNRAAPVTIVTFSDFQCPFCYRSFPTVKQVMETYSGKVRFVYRNYPLPNLFVSILQRMGIPENSFASGTGTMRGLEMI